MLNFPSFSLWSLWIILLFIFIFAWVVMAVANRLRGVKIENKEDHLNARTTLMGMPPFLALILLSVFTPIVPGPWFWIGCTLSHVGGVLYVLSIIAFVRAQHGLTTIGIYRLSRNPMYVATFIILIAFVLMALSSSQLMSILIAIAALWNIIIIHWMVLGEERFLEQKYGETYKAYKSMVPRYVPLKTIRKG